MQVLHYHLIYKHLCLLYTSTWGYNLKKGVNTSVSYSDSTPGIQYAYNCLNQLTQVADASGSRTIDVYKRQISSCIRGTGKVPRALRTPWLLPGTTRDVYKRQGQYSKPNPSGPPDWPVRKSRGCELSAAQRWKHCGKCRTGGTLSLIHISLRRSPKASAYRRLLPAS